MNPNESPLLQPVDYLNTFKSCVKKPIPVGAVKLEKNCRIKTLEGIMTGKAGDYLMQGIRGEFYICDQEIFEESYEWLE